MEFCSRNTTLTLCLLLMPCTYCCASLATTRRVSATHTQLRPNARSASKHAYISPGATSMTRKKCGSHTNGLLACLWNDHELALADRVFAQMINEPFLNATSVICISKTLSYVRYFGILVYPYLLILSTRMGLLMRFSFCSWPPILLYNKTAGVQHFSSIRPESPQAKPAGSKVWTLRAPVYPWTSVGV